MKRGSALLVVLGMLAFMLFSGLAFSVYMRQSRLPTSFLRRTASTRQLTKAALAEAIDHIDRAIGNDPHPGIRASGKAFNEDWIDNFWSHRVFFGMGTSSNTDESQQTQETGSYYPKSVGTSETVPTLPLEGLAYLPPNLINEVRYYSQRTPTAKWHSFWFDSGRYAYTAIDVSDYFDVNRIQADKPRAATAAQRISFAHLFEEGADHSSAGDGAAKWDNFMNQFRTVDEETGEITYNQYPFVSMADFNIAWGSQNLGGMKCPFYDFVKNGQPYDCGEAKEDADAETYRGMTFVTDSWFPRPSRSADGQVFYCCLEEEKYQPFKKTQLEKKNFKPSIDDVGTYAYSDSGMQSWAVTAGGTGGLRLNHLNFAALWDYLDVDSVPLSLCIPTVERTPMICGLRPYVDGEVELPLTQSPKAGETGSDVADEKAKQVGSDWWDLYAREITYTLDVSKLRSAFQDVRVLLTYPFRDHGYQCPDVDTSWTLDGRFSAFLTLGDVSARVADNKFTANPTKDAFKKLEVTDKSLVSFPLRGTGTISADNFKDKSSDIGMSCALSELKMDPGAPNAADLVLLKVKYVWPRDRYYTTVDKNGKRTPILDKAPEANVNPDPLAGMAGMRVEAVSDGTFYPLESTGQRSAGGWMTADKLTQSVDVKLNFAVWVRLANPDGDAVDFVPACQQDDVNMNDGKTSKCTQNCGGSGYIPLMRVAADGVNDGLKISLANLLQQQPTLGTVKFPDVKWIVADPRYNYAPENWVQTTGGGALQEADWRDNTEIRQMVEDRDGDGYMATSDVGYMQSIYELAFLPRVSNGLTDAAKGNTFFGNLGTTFDGKFAESHAKAKDADFMWKTYSPFDRYNGVDDFSELNTIMVSGEGPKVNPYSDSTKVLMTAFANTPHDWRLSADSDDAIFGMKGTEFNGKYAWNAYSSDGSGKLCWDCLEEFAEKLQDKVREEKYIGKWEKAFADLGWNDADKQAENRCKYLAGVELDSEDSDLYSVDKKFLYGFWHDCFAARQQLFLIFVRAEPMMMGGGVKGQIPPQLGARAVALVWRDPTATTGSRTVDGQTLDNPHRTRILFYHQFD